MLPTTQYPGSGNPDSTVFFSPPRNQKLLGKNKPEKQTPEVQDEAEAETRDDNNLNILRETLLSEKHNLAQVETELKEGDVPPVLLPDPQESET